MCRWLFKKKNNAGDIPTIEGSSPRTDTHTPSSAYLAGKMPTYIVDDLIKHLEFRREIHESYAGLVVQNPSQYPSGIYGDYEYQLWAIEGYENAIYYLEQRLKKARV